MITFVSCIFFPQHFMFAGLFFYIPDQAHGTYRNPKFLTPGGGEIIVVVIIAVLPTPLPPPHDFQKNIKTCTFLVRKMQSFSASPLLTKFEVH